MSIKSLLRISLLGVAVVSLAACSESNTDAVASLSPTGVSESTLLEVYKNPSCGCCGKWIEHMNANGFETQVHNQNDLSALKAEKGIAPRYQSCHTGVSADGYVFEGHIPAKLVRQFLTETPTGAIGLAAPGMPMGSPGMEMGSKFSPYDILQLNADGSSEIYAHIGKKEEQY